MHRVRGSLGIGLLIVMTPACATHAPAPRRSLQPERPIVSLIEYSDFQCPFARGGQPVVERVLAVYGQVVHYEYRHHPLSIHDYAMPAARRYEALRDRDEQAANQLRLILFSEQSQLREQGLAFIDKTVHRLGFDAKAIARDADSSAITARLQTQLQEVRANDFIDTPGYLVAGVPLRGPTSFEQFERIICRELRKARGVSEATDCWTLLQPDWQRLEQLDRGALVPSANH
jgi:predicted DsbA family dithiol-disulfide isomerase